MQLGLVGYSELQLTDDRGTVVTASNVGAKDRVHALGGEFGFSMPTKKLNFLFRAMPEYGAHSRTQGVTFLFAFAKTF